MGEGEQVRGGLTYEWNKDIYMHTVSVKMTYKEGNKSLAVQYIKGKFYPPPPPKKKTQWMTCNFTSFLTVSYIRMNQDGKMIMKGCVLWNPVYG